MSAMNVVLETEVPLMPRTNNIPMEAHLAAFKASKNTVLEIRQDGYAIQSINNLLKIALSMFNRRNPAFKKFLHEIFEDRRSLTLAARRGKLRMATRDPQ